MARHVFQHSSIMPTTMEQMLAFHSDPRALSRLTPFPIFIQVRQDARTSLTDGDIDLTMWVGPLPMHWVARHEPGPTETSFADRQILGPMTYWRHEHIFAPAAGGVRLTDRVTYEHPRAGRWAILTRLLFNKPGLWALFVYRHLRTRLGTRGSSTAVDDHS